jgi:eukaryotic-like serine/threonine-protein kinase
MKTGRDSVAATLLAAAETLEGPPPRRTAAGAPPDPARVGRYQVRGLLGEGAMGRVYRAYDPLERREVAIKTLKEAFASDDRALVRFRREADVASRCPHPGLVAVYDVGARYIVQELVEGESLEARLGRAGRFAPDEALPTLRAMAGALDHLHRCGVVHRDLKPANVMLTPGGSVKIADFGFAHVIGATLTRSGEMIGSPAYMAPEQIRGGDVDAAADLYALGVVAYEMLTGQVPFRGRSVGRVLESIVRDPPPLPSAACPGLPGAVDAVLAGALAKDPRGRPASGGAFVRALASVLARLPP